MNSYVKSSNVRLEVETSLLFAAVLQLPVRGISGTIEIVFISKHVHYVVIHMEKI